MPSPMPIARWMGSMKSRKRPNGRAVMPEATVSAVTASAPSSSPATDAASEAAKIRPCDVLRPAIGR